MSIPSSAPLSSFSPAPHRPDGGCPMSGLVMLAVACPIAGLALGVLAGVISQWFYFIILFPLCIGLGVGGIGAFVVTQGKVRSPLVCGLAGFLGGCVAVLCMHYYDYYSFENQLTEVSPVVRKAAAQFDQLQAKRAELPPEVQELLDDLARDSQLREALAVDGFRSHLDLMARRGVEISSKRGRLAGLSASRTSRPTGRSFSAKATTPW